MTTNVVTNAPEVSKTFEENFLDNLYKPVEKVRMSTAPKGIGKFIENLLTTSTKTYSEIVEDCKKHFDNATNTNKGCVSWYASKLKKANIKVTAVSK